jgi:hypothetical protein
MKILKNLFFAVLVIGGMLITSGWGFLVHKTAHQLAVYELPKSMQGFFYKNMDYLVYNSVRPDVRRSKDPNEATKHFIDAEAYGNDALYNMPTDWQSAVAKYSKDSLLKYGYVPYHVVFMKHQLTDAFKSCNKDSILFYAADLGHYIEDAHVPLHTSINYDGQLTNQKGLHALWETVVPEIEIDHYHLSSKHKASYLKNPETAIWSAVRGSNALVRDVFEKEKEVSANFTDATKYKIQNRNGKQVKYYSTDFAKAYAAALKNTINEQLIKSSNLLADFWYTAWVDAGKPDLTNLFSLSEDEKQQLKKEIKSFKKNNLIVDKYLQSKKEDKKTDE